MVYPNGWKEKALRACNLTKSERTLFIVLVHKADFMGRARLTQSDLAILTGLSRRTIIRDIPRMVLSGWVEVIQEGSGRRPHWYEIQRLWEPAL